MSVIGSTQTKQVHASVVNKDAMACNVKKTSTPNYNWKTNIVTVHLIYGSASII